MGVIIMTTSIPTYEKFSAMAQLKRGDKIKLTNGDIVEFLDLKQKRFTAIKNGASWSFPINSFLNLVEKAKEDDKTSEITALKPGELFYILKGGHMTVFAFESINGKTIHAKNPATSAGMRMDASFYEGKVSQFIK